MDKFEVSNGILFVGFQKMRDEMFCGGGGMGMNGHVLSLQKTFDQLKSHGI